MQAAKNGFRHDRPALRSTRWHCCCAWGTLTDRAEWAPVIEIMHIFRQYHPQMVLIEDEHAVQTFGSQGSRSALGDGVGLRRPENGSYLGDTKPPDPPMDENVRCLPIPSTAFDDLLGCPFSR